MGTCAGQRGRPPKRQRLPRLRRPLKPERDAKRPEVLGGGLGSPLFLGVLRPRGRSSLGTQEASGFACREDLEHKGRADPVALERSLIRWGNGGARDLVGCDFARKDSGASSHATLAQPSVRPCCRSRQMLRPWCLGGVSRASPAGGIQNSVNSAGARFAPAAMHRYSTSPRGTRRLCSS
jgi:hypothetical protein